MIYHDLTKLTSDRSKEDFNSIIALLTFQVESNCVKLGSFSNNYVPLLKYEATINNLICNSLIQY